MNPFTKKDINPTEPTIAPEPIAQPAPIALVTLAAELPDLSIGELLARLGTDDVFIEPATGLRCVSVETCRRVIDEHAAAAVRRVAAQRVNEAKMLANLPRPTRSIPDEQFQELVEAQR